MRLTKFKFPFFLASSLLIPANAWAAPAHVSVLGPDGKPLVGAAVEISETLNFTRKLPVRNLTTDAAGSFTIELDEGTSPRHVYSARILAPGLTVAGRNLQAGAMKFQLQAAQNWGGVVLDSQQKPLEGVRLKFTSWQRDNLSFDQQGVYLPSELALEAVTDATGHYSFKNLPQTGRAVIKVDDPRFQKADYNFDISQQEAPPIFIQPAGTVTGRILTAEGQPLGDIDIAVFNRDRFDYQHVGADGIYSIGSLGPDQKSLRCLAINEGWVLKPLTFDPLEGGETRRLPDWIATKALNFTGKIVDAVTKKPVPNVSVQIMSEAREECHTDAQGQFKTRSSGDVIYVRLNSETHVEKLLQQVSAPANATQFDMGTIEMTPGIRLAGTISDEKGKPMSYFSFTLTNKDQHLTVLINSTDGVIESRAVSPGTYDLAPAEFQIVSPKTVEIPKTGTMAPIKLVVDTSAKSKRTFNPVTVSGRVVDEKGLPIAGAVVVFKAERGFGIGGTRATSDHNGRFIDVFVGKNQPEIQEIQRPGFIMGDRPNIAKVGEEWHCTDIVLQPRGQIFTGHILQAGTPVAGARVALAGINWREPATSDATGTFHFEDLPRGDLEFLAASTNGFGSLKTRGDAKDVTLNLEPVPAYDAKQIAGDLVNEQATRGDWRNAFDIFGAQAMEIISLRGDKAMDATGTPKPGAAGYKLYLYFNDLVNHDPDWLVQRGPQLIPLFREGLAKARSEAMLARVQALSDNDAARMAAAKWLDREKEGTKQIIPESVSQLFAMAEVATNLKRPDAAALLELGLTYAVQIPDKLRADSAEHWGVQTARISPQAFDALLQDYEPVPALRVLTGGIRTFSRRGDVASARLYLQKMEELQLSPAIKAADLAEPAPNQPTFNSSGLLADAKREVARALAKTDVFAATQIAAGIDSERSFSERLNALLDVARNAQEAGSKEFAIPLQEIAKSDWQSPDHLASAASIAMKSDPTLGALLFKKSLAAAAYSNENVYKASASTWALRNAAFDPALSRVILEREWSWTLPVYQAELADKKVNPAVGSYSGKIAELAWVMSVFDPQRALQWLKEIPTGEYESQWAKAMMAAVLIATPAQRDQLRSNMPYEAPDL